ncbi:MAG: sodium-translocating pyrophosphatase [Candidatus Nanopelagicales bacterium]|nr:sodium-translocating pyrophosphatase [Candidatus Nanopelagicales bacterium]
MSAGTVAASVVTLTGGSYTTVIVVALIALLALVVAGLLVREVLAASEGTDNMKDIAAAVQEGAAAYLSRQFRTLSIFAVIVFFVLFLLPAETTNEKIGRSIFFLVGAVFSAVTGYVGMWLAVRANVRVAAAAREGKSGETKAMRIAFRTGGVAGMFTVGLGLLGAAIVVLVYKGEAPKVLEGFGFGAALLAMFMRVGGGIFTKAADVGADLVGKVEQGIPEDDPRNAATIADNVGDNVGDCAGMAADLFESYAVTLVAALILGQAALGSLGLVIPLVVPAIGVITAIIGIFAVSPRANDRSGMAAINRGFFISAIISAVLVAVAAFIWLPDRLVKLTDFDLVQGRLNLDVTTLEVLNPRFLVIAAVLIGIILAAAIQQLTGYFTETNRKPVDDVARTSLTGPATVILSGISLGLESAVYSALLIGAAVYGAFLLGSGSITLSLFAVAMAGTGLLTTVGVIVAMDTFGPVSDNAQGIAEMSGDVEGEGAAVLTSLDAVGNTTKAITKGIAIATAVLAATALFGSFRDAVVQATAEAGDALQGLGVQDASQYLGILDISNPRNLVGLIIGSSVVFLFSGLAINAVTRAAGAIIFEVRRQFTDHPGIMEGTEKPEYGKVVDICTRDSLRELSTPGLLAILTPIAVGFGLGIGALGSFLAGTIATDPFKDTAGPAINPLIKVMNLVSLLIAPAVVSMFLDGNGLRWAISIGALAIVVGAVIVTKRRPIAVSPEEIAASTSA